MFNEIKNINKPFPYQSFSIALCAVGVTVGTLIFPNFNHVYGSFKSDINLLQYLSLPFQHGYDTSSAIVHLIPLVILFLFVGGTSEKLMGPNKFFLFNSLIILVYGIAHKVLGMIGHGLTPVLFAYVPIIGYSLNEGRLIKTRSMYDEYYKTLWAILLIIVILIPILLSFVPIYFDSNSTLSQQIIQGNLLHLVLLLTGLGYLRFTRETIRHRLLHFARKKKFLPHSYEKLTPYLALSYPLLLLLILLMDK